MLQNNLVLQVLHYMNINLKINEFLAKDQRGKVLGVYTIQGVCK